MCVVALSCSKHFTQVNMFKVTPMLTFCSIESLKPIRKFINTGSKTGKTRTWFETALIYLCSYVTVLLQLACCLYTSSIQLYTSGVQLRMYFIARSEKISFLWISNLRFPSWLLISLMTYWNSDKLLNFKVNGLSWTVSEFTMFFKNDEWFYE